MNFQGIQERYIKIAELSEQTQIFSDILYKIITAKITNEAAEGGT